jgi:signal transduction histidine kinase
MCLRKREMVPTAHNLETDPEHRVGRMSTRTAGRLAVFSWLLYLLFAGAALVIMFFGWSAVVPTHETLPVLFPLLLATLFSTVGALVASRRPENLISWIMCATGLLSALNALAASYAAHALYSGSEPLPGAAFAAWANVFTGSIPLLPFLLLLFPNGRLPSRRWRPVVWLIIGTGLAEIAAGAFAPGRFPGWPSASNPFGVALLDPLLDLYVTYAQTPLLVLTVLLPVICLLMRFWRSRGVERQQLKWFVSTGVLVAFAATLLFAVGARSSVLIENVLWGFLVLAACAVPASMGVAIVRYRLWDIDFLINRALVYGTLSVIVVGLYVLVVGSFGVLLQARGNVLVSLLATGLIAVLFAPLHARLQRSVNRLIYGERDDPFAVLSRMGERLEATLVPQAVLPTIAETLAQALKLPYVAIELKQDGEFVKEAEYGKHAPDAPLILPLTYGAETVGRLVTGRRSPEEEFSNSDRKLLEDLARQVGIAAHAVRLTTDLQRSRERLVASREEERRRLRRDLHDGVGPQLAALTLKLETARNRLSHDSEAQALLSDLAERARAAVADIRRAVHALRPPALDELGLVPALREVAAQYSHKDLSINLDAPQDLPPLPAAIEVACYRITQEALTNVVRHAGASSCSVRLALEGVGMVHLEVIDDGGGVGEDHKVGVGLFSMRERAEELGGTCTIEPLPGSGTRVNARLPCQLPNYAHPKGD